MHAVVDHKPNADAEQHHNEWVYLAHGNGPNPEDHCCGQQVRNNAQETELNTAQADYEAERDEQQTKRIALQQFNRDQLVHAREQQQSRPMHQLRLGETTCKLFA